MEVINYKKFVNEIILSQKFQYDCETLSSLSSLMIYDEIEIQDEDDFYDIFSELVFYFSSVACDDEKKFKEVIDEIVILSNQGKLSKADILFALNKSKIVELVTKYRVNVITIKNMNRYLKTVFVGFSISDIYNYLNDKVDIKLP